MTSHMMTVIAVIQKSLGSVMRKTFQEIAAEVLAIPSELLIWSHAFGIKTCRTKRDGSVIKIPVKSHVLDSALGNIAISFL